MYEQDSRRELIKVRYLLFDRIIPPRMKRMAPQEATYSHPDAAHRPVPIDSLKSIFRTGRNESA